VITIAALGGFGLRLVLKNVKYRYIVLDTMPAAVFYLFTDDHARNELVSRIPVLLLLAVMPIGLFICYKRRSRNKQLNE
jgi:hypothetical protein